ncbi:MAG: type II toxin-antitoxin system PemK/MazF family toxin [Lachnospiraceae bacterium]|nr:type II toxin-antitoxin system PemK/MazF family toxin [Lachnospiraceae bacterium]
MKHTATMEDASLSFDNTVSTLRKHFTHIDHTDSEKIKLANEYYKWTTLKTDLIMGEKNFQIPSSALPNIIKKSVFDWLRPDKQAIELIMRSIVLVRKAVVWVDFGYNIGTEFGGRHPAIILKNLKDSLIVIPLSSQNPKSMEYNVKVDKVYGFPLMDRWANVTRISQVSLSRVHFQKIGDVKPSVLNEISNKISQCGMV